MKKTFYYSNEQTDDFGTTVTKTKPLPKNYKYISTSWLFKVFEFIVYDIIVRPLAFLYLKIKFCHKVKNNKVLKEAKKGAMLFCNHTLLIGDAFVPNVLNFRTKNYILTGDQANSLTGILPLMKALGMIPLTDDVSQNVKMAKCIKQRLSENATVTVFPEAHVWPYYTKIRDFKETGFKYATMNDVPVYAVTNCFKKRRLFKTPKVTTFVDGPFYPSKDLSRNENAKMLKEKVISAMRHRCETESTYVAIDYVKKEN